MKGVMLFFTLFACASHVSRFINVESEVAIVGNLPNAITIDVKSHVKFLNFLCRGWTTTRNHKFGYFGVDYMVVVNKP